MTRRRYPSPPPSPARGEGAKGSFSFPIEEGPGPGPVARHGPPVTATGPSPRRAGDPLPEVRREVTQGRVNAYAEAANDFNPIHLDAAYAAQTQFGRRIAHGMLTLAFLAEMMAQAFPDTWHKGGRLKVRFKAPVFLGEAVTAFGEVSAVTETPDGPLAECRVGCRRPDGEEAVTGQAWALLGPSRK